MLKVRRNLSPPPPIGCPLAGCMKMLAGAWTPHIIWNLCGGRRRFSEIRGDIPGISAKVLSARLKELQARGIVDRHVIDTSPPSVEYSLTDLGRQLIPALQSIADVGTRLLGMETEACG